MCLFASGGTRNEKRWHPGLSQGFRPESPRQPSGGAWAPPQTPDSQVLEWRPSIHVQYFKHLSGDSVAFYPFALPSFSILIVIKNNKKDIFGIIIVTK